MATSARVGGSQSSVLGYTHIESVGGKETCPLLALRGSVHRFLPTWSPPSRNGAMNISSIPPVLVTAYNRPHMVNSLIRKIRQVAPTRIYFVVDGPKSDRPSDVGNCHQTQDAIAGVDWDCEVKTLFRDENLGLRRSVAGAIGWFFENETQGIILEDDCLPDPSFFDFCAELLTRHADDHRVFQISGNSFAPDNLAGSSSYYFSRYNFIWGWATWRDRWLCNDVDFETWDLDAARRLLNQVGDGNQDFTRYWLKHFRLAISGEVDSWAYPWTYSVWKHGGLTALPRCNLVSNVGFGNEATHTRHSSPVLDRAPTNHLSFPLTHPTRVASNREADRWADLHVFQTMGVSYRVRLKNRLRRIARSTIASFR